MGRSIILTCLMALFLASPALAGDFFLTPKIGTQGFGADAGYQFNDMFKARLNANYFSLSHDSEIEDVDYEADLSNLTIGLLGDWHPWRNGFRLTAGAYLLDFNADVDAKLSDNKDYTIGDNTYSAAELGSISADVDWNDVAPYVGVGWGTDGTTNSGWAFCADLGAMYIGKPSLSYSATGAASNPMLAADIEREKNKVEDDIDRFQWYPVLSIGATYRF